MLKKVSRKKFGSLLVLVALSLCISMGAQNGCNMAEKIGGSTAAGGALGAIGGALAGDPLTGALIGLGAGAIGGTIWAASTDDTSISDDMEKLQSLSGTEMSRKELSTSLAYVGVSPETRDSILVDVDAVVRKHSNATFIINRYGQIIRYN